ncbi:transglycosylase domain-containing protein [Xylanimonas ulmi]|uniref:Membrane peptidoglycan carboxypeptidase n=1 Tax=Xylanimonas ulmi TaxID=228973 RepID=A0A4Q7M5A2_9MICO|nr:transglycosylase domain-containing protein [Xylanibacterium ulmi]RZS62601.1 membrane peptidoglycan carboxypeptidase [Xylanibacterium ulmi]
MATSSARRPANRRRRFWNYPRRGKGPIHRWIPSWRVVLGSFLGVFALGAGVVVAAFVTTEVPTTLGSVNNQITTIYYSDGATPIGTLGDERRVKVALDDLPPFVAGAVVSSEDSTFWTNHGVDPRGLARALWNNVRGLPTQGGSTITQQFVERTKLYSATSLPDKAREMIIALKVTRSMPKEEILESYLNTIYWGRNVLGIEAASQAYFGKSAKDLTYSEAALLSGIIPSPNNWDPDVNETQAKRRWQRSINRMYTYGYITQEQRDSAEFPTVLPRPAATNTLGGQAGFLVRMVEDELKQTDAFRDHPEWIRTRGLNIVTTIDPRLQDAAVSVAESAFTGDNPADPAKLSVGLVSMDPTTGELRAVYGGKDYVTQQFNFATQGRAQGGSTFKPFTLIGALEEGHSLTERFDGRSQIPIAGWDSESGLGPRNFDGANFRSIDLLQATADSVNTVYAQLNIAIGPDRTVDVAHRLGIPESIDIAAVPSNVLGVASVSAVNLATAYSTIAGQGQRVTPHIVREVRGLDGTLLHQGPTERTREFEPDVMAAATYALTQVVEKGSGATAQELRGPNGEQRPSAGKTGTSNDNISAWYAGFVPQLVTVVGLHQESTDDNGRAVEQPIDRFGQWINSRSGMTGSTFPVRAWTDFMKVALDGVPVEDFPSYTPPRPTPSPEPTPTQEETPTEEPTVEEPPADPQAGWVTVPDRLVGRNSADVVQKLQALGLRVNVVEQDAPDPASTVLSVSTPSGQRVPPGSTLTITVSKGPAAPPPTQTPAPTPTPTPTPTDPAHDPPDSSLLQH